MSYSCEVKPLGLVEAQQLRDGVLRPDALDRGGPAFDRRLLGDPVGFGGTALVHGVHDAVLQGAVDAHLEGVHDHSGGVMAGVGLQLGDRAVSGGGKGHFELVHGVLQSEVRDTALVLHALHNDDARFVRDGLFS